MFSNICKFIYFLFIIIISLAFPISKTMAAENYQILFLTSHTPGHKVFDQQLLGIQESFSYDSDNTYKLYVEYMDTSNLDMNINFSNFESLLDLKSYIYNDIDAIVVADNLTLDFLISLDNNFDKSIPRFFLGIDNKELIDLAIQSGFSGGIEKSVSIEETIDSINIITKQATKNLIFILPNSSLYKNDLDRFYDVSKKYTNFKFSHMYIPNSLDESFLKSINNLNNKDNIVLFLGPYKHYINSLENHTNSCYTLLNMLNIPVFSLINYFDFDYSVGGKVIDIYNQGLELGKLVSDKLNSDSPPKFIDFKSANKWIFNYHKLKEFNLKKYKVPSDIQIIGSPVPLYK